MSGFVLLKFLSYLVLPPASMGLGLLIGALVAFVGWRRLGLTIVLLAVIETLGLSTAPLSDALVASLERDARQEATHAIPCCYSAIVILGGGSNQTRVLHGLELYKANIAPRIVVTGGDLASAPDASKPEGESMKSLLLSLGIPSIAIVAEDAARNTAENMANVKEIVGDEAIALVTSAYHMRRALKLAQRSGLKAYAFPTDFMARAAQRPLWDNWLPTVGSLQTSVSSLWEYIGLAFDYRAVRQTPSR